MVNQALTSKESYLSHLNNLLVIVCGHSGSIGQPLRSLRISPYRGIEL